MKAKMKDKPPESAQYMCTQCNCEFGFEKGNLVCPECGNSKRAELVTVEKDNDPDEEGMYTPDDWHGG